MPSKPFFALLAALLVCGSTVSARSPALKARDSTPTPLSSSDVASYKTYTYYASAAYCDASTTRTWTCGPNCEANPHFAPVASGGDGSTTQFWFVGYDSALSTVVVSHQGTDLTKLNAILTDTDALLSPLNSTLFPNAGSDVQVHTGFAAEHASTATTILSAVLTALSTYKTNHVSVVGHSLGSALAVLESLYLRLNLPTTVVIKTVGYGVPRIGNQAFADLIDSKLPDFHRINNKADFWPYLPPTSAGYHHPSGELYITYDGDWQSCSGQENDSCYKEYVTASEDTILAGDGFTIIAEHNGPYDGVTIGCTAA